MRGRNAGQEPGKVWKELELRGGRGHLEESQDQNEVEQLFLLHVTTPRLLRMLALSASNCSRSMLPPTGLMILSHRSVQASFRPSRFRIHSFG